METTDTRSTAPPGTRVDAGRPHVMVIGGARVGELHELSRERTVVGRGPDAGIRLGDEGVSRAHAELVVAGESVRVRDLGSTNGTYLNGERMTAERELRAGDKLTVGEATLLVFLHGGGLESAYHRGRLHAAVHDPATDALKREVFLERLVEEVSYARRHAAPLAVLAWEVEGWDGLAATLDEQEAPRVLARAARAARAVLEDGDLLATLAPGKFALACRATDAGAGLARAAALRGAVAGVTTDSGALAASVGIATVTAGAGSNGTASAATNLLARADAALASARTSGTHVALDAPSRDSNEP